MILQKCEEYNDVLYVLRYKTAYKNNWKSCLCFAKEFSKIIERLNVAVSLSENERPTDWSAKSGDEIMQMPEGIAIYVNGLNKLYNNAFFQFVFYNHSNTIHVFITKDCIDKLNIIEKYSAEEKEENKFHIFNKMMNTIEFLSTCTYIFSGKETSKKIEDTIRQIFYIHQTSTTPTYG